MGVKLKLATREDIKGIIDLTNKCFEENTDYDFARKMFLETEKDPNQLHLIATSENSHEILGYLKITIIPAITSPMETYAILNHICVNPSARREGIGTRLLAEAERLALEHGAHNLTLWTKNFRQAAQALYRSCGFKTLDAKVFEKEIGDK